MKMKQALTMSAGLAFASIASAQTVDITITGSTAFRADMYRAIRSMYNGGLPALQNPADSASTSKSNIVTFSGLMTPQFGSRTVIVRTSYSGSVDGVKDLATLGNNPYITNPDPAGGFGTTLQTPDFALSDCYQASTAFGSPTLQDNQVGVIPFVWVRNSTCPASVANMTEKLASGIFPLGIFPLAQWSGNVADFGTLINIVGRDNLSGTRVIVLAETGYGIFTPLTQRKASGGTYVDDSVGYSSGGSVATDLNLNVGPAISYLGLSDAATVTGAGGVQLTYNGTTYSAANVRNGSYTYWSYEHLFNRSGLSTDKTTFRTALIPKINTEVGANTSAVQLSTMNVQRLADGAVVTP